METIIILLIFIVILLLIGVIQNWLGLKNQYEVKKENGRISNLHEKRYHENLPTENQRQEVEEQNQLILEVFRIVLKKLKEYDQNI